MREAKKTERIHLPRGAMEAWLKSQAPRRGEARRHRTPPEDIYEVWVQKRVGEILRRKGAAA